MDRTPRESDRFPKMDKGVKGLSVEQETHLCGRQAKESRRSERIPGKKTSRELG